MKKVTSLDAIRTFYANEELLSKAIGGSKKPLTKKTLETKLKSIIRTSKKLSKNFLLKYHLDNWHPRYDNYLNSEWELKEIKLEDCGAWPNMSGLPSKFTKGNIIETAVEVKSLLKDKNKLSWSTAKVLYIEELVPFAETITKYLPLVVMEGSVIRNNKLNKRETNRAHSKTLYDIDDGNHRAVAIALSGKKKVLALVGKRIYKSPLIY